MSLFLNKKPHLSKWFIPIAVIWGLLAGEVPAQGEKLLELQILFPRLIVFTILGILFYFGWKYLKKWIVITIVPLLGIAMEFGFMRPDDIPFGNVHDQKPLAALFFAIAWSIIIIPSYFITTFITQHLPKKLKREK